MTTAGLNKRVLVVDDSRVIRTIVGRALLELGFEVAQAANGREALNFLKLGTLPSVMMVDWNMPEMGGLEMVKAVRSTSAWNEVRLVMITSENDTERVVEALDAGADEYIMKPFTREMIREKLLLIGVEMPNLSAA